MANTQDFTSPNTGTSLAAMDAGSVRKLWKQGALVGEQSEDFFQEMESKSQTSLIWSQTDLSKGKGHSMTFTNMSGFYNEPKVGEELFEGPADFESVDIGSYELTVDYVRNAVRHSERMEEVMGMRGEIASGFNVELGKWLGRYKTEQLLGMFKLKLNSENVTCANGKTKNTLGSADVLVWDEIVTTGQAMKPLGGLPANIAGKGKAPIWSQAVIATEVALGSLKLDNDYKLVLTSGDVRGRGNTLFKGGYPSIDGHVINPYNPIDHDGVGAVGSFLNPKAFLGVAHTDTADTARVLKGGGNVTDAAKTGKLFFKYFGGFAYKFIDTLAITADAGPHYAIIYNTTGANIGKWGFVKYTTGNDGNLITTTEFLGAANGASGTIRKTTVGSLAWNATYNTEEWSAGALIIQANSKGVPIGDTLFLGQAAALRGYGKHRAKRSQENHNGEFIMDRFITSVFGQCIREDRKGRHPAVMRLTHAVTYPGISLPVIS